MKRVDTDSGRGSSSLTSSSQYITPDPLTPDPDTDPDTDPNYYRIPLPPDGGYGWVIVGVCFLCYATVDGLAGVLGVILPHILVEFHTTRALASLAGSVMVGALYTVGPLVGASINLFTCRSVSVVGGIVLSLACFLSSFSPNIETFILLYGGAMGIGAGILYIPMSVMPGYYFERRRAIANGIACSGSGVGMLGMPLITAWLLEYYTWRNVLIILAGLAMQAVVCGALMRPLIWRQNQRATPLPAEEEEQLLEPTSEMIRSSELKQSGSVELPNSYNIRPGSNGGRRYVLGSEEIKIKQDQCNVEATDKLTDLKTFDSFSVERLTQSCQGLPTNASRHKKSKPHKFPTPASVNVRHSKADGPDKKRVAGNQPFNVRKIRKDDEISPVLTSCYEFSKIPDIAEKELPKKGQQVDRKRMRYELLQPFARQDVFYAGSILSLKEYKCHANMTSYITSVTSLPTVTDSSMKCCGRRLSPNVMKSMLHPSILLDPCFLIMAVSGITMVFGYYVPIVFMADQTSSLGISATGAASLIAIFGITNSIGRVLSGALASSGWIDPLHIHVWSMVAAGLSCCLMVTVCSTFLHLAFTVGAYGLTLGMFVPLTTVFLVQYLGLSRLTNAYGFLFLVKGLLGMAGPTISGAMIDQTGTFTSAYFFGGGMLAFSGLSLYLLPLADIWKKRIQAKKDHFTRPHKRNL